MAQTFLTFTPPFEMKLTSRPRLKETLFGGFLVLRKSLPGVKKNKRIDGYYSEFFAKSIGENNIRLAFIVWGI